MKNSTAPLLIYDNEKRQCRDVLYVPGRFDLQQQQQQQQEEKHENANMKYENEDGRNKGDV